MDGDELQLRNEIMARLSQIAARNGGYVSRRELEEFEIRGKILKLVDQSRGIRNPKELSCTLTIISDPKGTYDDRIRDDGLLEYAYQRGSDQGTNAKMRIAMQAGAPIILLRKEAKATYIPIMPTYIVHDDVDRKMFYIALDENVAVLADSPHNYSPLQKQYAQRIVRQRLHQPQFRVRVLRAYKVRCSICSLAHGELLDAAHIIADSHDQGAPEVSNGMALCKIHHTAFDQAFLGITPDYKVEIDSDLLAERDGPMLKHGLQEMHGRTLLIPDKQADWPSRDALATRYEAFRAS